MNRRAPNILGPSLLLAGVLAAGCTASSAPKPTFSRTIAAASVVRADDGVAVDVSAAPNVALTDEQKARLTALIEEKIAKHSLENAPDGTPGTYEIDVLITEYDEGSAFARFMSAGLGQIHVNAKVTMSEMPARQVVGAFDVSKTFAWGDIPLSAGLLAVYGGSTSIQDVEVGFAEGIASAVTQAPD